MQLHNYTDAAINYLADRQYRSNLFFNLSVLVFGALLAKIASNFAFEQPGFAGFRVILAALHRSSEAPLLIFTRVVARQISMLLQHHFQT